MRCRIIKYTFCRCVTRAFISWIFLLGSISCLIGSGIAFSEGCMNHFFCPKYSITHTSVTNITAKSLGGINAFIPLIEFESNCVWVVNTQKGLQIYLSPNDAIQSGEKYYSIGDSVSVLKQELLKNQMNENESECVPLFYTVQYVKQ